MTTTPGPREVGLTPEREAAVRHAADVAAAHAAEVDRAARFPDEAVTALRDSGLLAAAAPVRLGGHEMTCRDLVRVAQRLARGCGATAMIWAMHQIQLACVARHHPDSPLLERAVKEQWLIASVTSEAGVGGDLRRSTAGVLPGPDGGSHTVRKQGTTVSYAADAQGYLVTARRSADADQADQIAVLVSREQVDLAQTSGWNTLGMRGTCSPSYDLELTFHSDQVLPVPFGDIAARTMVPLSHLLWSGVWVGLATEAVRRAVAVTRQRSRGAAGPGNPALAQAHARLAGARGQLAGTVAACEPVLDHGHAPTMTLAAEVNALKLGVSEAVVDVVRLALEVTGMAGFTEDGPYSVARILRDVHSAPLMISNHRLLATNAQLLLALRGER